MKKRVVLWILTGCVIIALCASIPNIVTTLYLKSIFIEEELSESYDERYGYLQLSSPKKLVCNLRIYDMKAKNGDTYKQTLDRSFDQRDMEDISWGNQSYDLFFLTDEARPYIYKYISSGQWLGPLYFDINETKEKRSQGDADSYCFDISVEANIEDFPEYDYSDVIVLTKEIIPKSFLKRIDSILALYLD